MCGKISHAYRTAVGNCLAVGPEYQVPQAPFRGCSLESEVIYLWANKTTITSLDTPRPIPLITPERADV
jgi:hypothetical protein